MEWDTPFKCAIGTTAFFKAKCKRCGSMTVNSGLEFSRDPYGEDKLVFECFECGRKWRHSYKESIDHAFIKYTYEFAKVIVVSYKGTDHIATVLDEDRVLLMKPEKSKVVSSSEVTMASGTVPISQMDKVEHLVGLEAIKNAGTTVNVMKCECGEYMIGSKIENIWWVHCKERFKCRSCDKVVERSRYGYRAPGIEEHPVVVIKSAKTGKLTHAVDMVKGYLIYKNGMVHKVKRSKATIVG